MAKLKYLGVPVYMNGQNYYIPSLSTRDFKANYELLTTPAADDEKPGASFDRYIPVILLAVQRNYPEVTLGDLEDWLDLHTFREAIQAVQAAAGLKPVSEGE
jgi:hypothetical protein